MKKLISILSLLAFIPVFCIISCKDDESGIEPNQGPQIGTIDTVAWPFDDCIDSTIVPGNDFYAYISAGYTKKYTYGVMSGQYVVGYQVSTKELNSPSNDIFVRLDTTWADLTETAIMELEKTSIKDYNEKVDNMNEEELMTELIHNSVCDRLSIIDVGLNSIARKPCLYLTYGSTINRDAGTIYRYSELMDTTQTFVEELYSQVQILNDEVDHQIQLLPDNQKKLIRSVIDPTYHPEDLDPDTRLNSKISTRATTAKTTGDSILLRGLSLHEDEFSLLNGTSDEISSFVNNLYLLVQVSPKYRNAIVAYLKLARLEYSYDISFFASTTVTKLKFKNFKYFNMLLSNAYCKHGYVTNLDVNACEELAEQFRNTFRTRIDSLDWMSPTTKILAKKKLDNMKFWYGLPKSDASSFDILFSDEDFAMSPSECSSRLSQRFYTDIVLPTLRKGEFDDDFIYLMQSVSNDNRPFDAQAYYDDENNSMMILASNLVSPITRNDVSLPYNYAVIGATTIGHEMCHAFDVSGSKYDEVGNLKNWWTVSDLLKYKDKQAQMIHVFDQYEFTDSKGAQFQVDGDTTLAENMADLGGAIVGLDALCRLRRSQGYDEEGLREQMRRYFLSWGIGWSENTLYRTDKDDEHAPNCIRVNGILNLLDDWYDVFNVKWGDYYYLEPSQRIKLW